MATQQTPKPPKPAVRSMPCSATLRWTTRKPKRPGWWWLAAPTGYTPRIVKVWQNEDGKLIVDAESNGWPLSRPYRAGNIWKGCRWYGPLVAPDRHWIAATSPNNMLCREAGQKDAR